MIIYTGTPPLGMTRGEYSVFDLPRRDGDIVGHTLTVTVMPRADDMETQTFLRSFRTGMLYIISWTISVCMCVVVGGS